MKPLLKIGGNVLSLLTSTIISRLGTFLVYLLVGRYLSEHKFGQFSLGITYFQTFQLLAIAGLQILITREVAKDKSKTNQYLITGSVIVLVFSLVSICLLWLAVDLLNYAADTRMVILLIAVSLFPFALSEVCDAIFLAWEKMHHIATSNLVVTVVKVGLTFLLVTFGYDLIHIAGVLVLTHLLGFVIKLTILSRTVVRPTFLFEPAFGLSLIQATLTFLGIRGAKAILNSLDVIILSKFAGVEAVGYLAAAGQLMVPIGMVLDSGADSMFPVMVRGYKQGHKRLKIAAEQLFEGMLMLVIPATFGIFMLSDSILAMLYTADKFVHSSSLLKIMIWILILRTMTRVLGATLIVSGQEKKTLRILIVDVIATIIISPIMIIQFGLTGAAIAVVAVRVVDALQHYLPIVRFFPDIAIFRSVWKPLIASIAMTIYLSFNLNQNLFYNIVAGGAIYIALLSVLIFLTVGGLRQIKQAYLGPWLEQKAVVEPELTETSI